MRSKINKMFIYFNLLIALFCACECKIRISVVTSEFANKTIIKFAGADTKDITKKYVKLFNITNENLNEGIKVEMGKVPDEIFLKDPTYYGDLFKNYKWPELQRKMIIRKAAVIEFFKEDVVLRVEEIINNTTRKIKSNRGVIAETVTNSVSTDYKKGWPEDDINYDIDINFGYGNASCEASWRVCASNVFYMSIKKVKPSFDIAPGTAIQAKLLAERIILLIAVEFDAHLVGNIIANYAQLYGKYHYWAPTIGNIMRAANINNKITTTMLLEVRFYANERLLLVNKETGEVFNLMKRRFNLDFS